MSDQGMPYDEIDQVYQLPPEGEVPVGGAVRLMPEDRLFIRVMDGWVEADTEST